jgi:two pore calcium channel protein
MSLFLILNQDFPELRTIPLDEAKLLFAILDKDGTETISKKEFMDFGNILLLEFERISLHKHLIERCFPRLFVSDGYKAFAAFIESNAFEFTIDAILVLNAVVVFIQSYAMLMGEEVDMSTSISDGSIDTVWEFFESIFTCIYVVEISVKILVKGWHNFSQSNRNIFDMIMTVLAVFATAYVYYPNEFSDSRLIRFIVMARVLRLARLLVLLAPFQMIAKIAIDVFARARVILLLLFCVCYIFGAFGVQVFGGMITRDPEDPRSFLLLGSDFAANDYWANSFNDMFSAMNVLFNLLVINNWTECQDGFEAVTQHRYNRLFFVAFHIVGVILVNNLVLAFIINAFINQWDYRQEELKTHIVKGEAVIIGRHALFDAQQVTGTDTQLKGQYMAKIGRRTLFDEQHQQRVLRSMFTSSVGEEADEPSADVLE